MIPIRAASFISLAALLAFAATLAGNPTPARGASFTVDATHDAVDATPGDGICADAGGACTLRAAVMETNALAGADEVALPAGTFNLTISGAGEDLSATGDLDFTDDLLIGGVGAEATIIDGGGLDRVLHHPIFPDVLPAPEVVVTHLTVRNGASGSATGGAVHNSGSLAFQNVVVIESTADFFGGGVMNDGAMTLNNSTIGPGNGATYGAGVFNFGVITIADSTIDGNAAGSQGGGFYNFGTATITGSTLSVNSAASDGGGIVNDGGTLNITNSTISGNTAGDRGGGIANGSVTPGFRIAPMPDSGPVEHNVPAHLTMLNATLAFNSANAGGNLFHVVGSTASLQNTLLATGQTGGNCAGAITSLGHNLADDGTCGFAAAGDISGAPAGVEPLADNGGPTQAHALRRTEIHQGPFDAVIHMFSAAIDTGDNAACPGTDQRKEPRPFDGGNFGQPTCDIGAFELQQGPLIIFEPGGPTAAPTAAPTATPVPPVVLPRTGSDAGSPSVIPLSAAALVLIVGLAFRRYAGRARDVL